MSGASGAGANSKNLMLNLQLQRQAAATEQMRMKASGSVNNVAQSVNYNPSLLPVGEDVSASSAMAPSAPNQNMGKDILSMFGDLMHVASETKETKELQELSRRSTLAYESLANFALSAPNASVMTACRTCEKVDIAQARLVKNSTTGAVTWKPVAATCASNMGLLEFYFTWFRFAWWVNMWVQMFMQDAYMSLLSIVIIFGVFAFFELVFLVGASHVYFRSVRSSYFSCNVYFVQWLLFIIAVFATAGTANIYQSSKNKAGFNFEIALPSGTGVSTNDAFNQGTQILAIPTNVYVNIQLFVIFGVWIGIYFLLFAKMGHVVRHSRHPDKHALY